MAKLLKLRRGTSTQHASFTGAEGEVTIDTTKDTAVVHDGSTQGGTPLAKENMSNVSSASIVGRIGTGAIQGTQLENSGVTAGQYGSSSAIPIVTVDAQGLVTAASTTAVDSTKIQNGTTEVATASSGDITMKRSGTTRIVVGSAGAAVTGNLDVSAGVDVTGNVAATGNVTAVNITASNDVTAKDIVISDTTPTLVFADSDHNPDFKINVDGGSFIVRDSTNSQDRLKIHNGGTVQVFGNITVGGTVDGVDVANLKTAKDSLSTSNGVIKNGVSLANGVTASTQSAGDNSTKVATTAYVRSAITAHVFPSGTKMLFNQTSAPTGWTKVTTHNNKALRVVSGTAGSGGSNAFTNTLASRGITANSGNTTAGGNVSVGNTASGGNVNISSVSTGGTVNNHTLSTNQMPSHYHNILKKGSQHNCRGSACGGGMQGGHHQSSQGNQATGNTGGGGAHSHGFSGSSHNHNASFSGSNHNHNASFSGNAHNHSITVTNLDMAVQYVDVIIATKD